MKNRITYTLFILISIAVLCNSFVIDNPYFKITKKDVKLKIPKGFPKPIYNFKKNKLKPDIFILGRKLFYDNILSKLKYTHGYISSDTITHDICQKLIIKYNPYFFQ